MKGLEKVRNYVKNNQISFNENGIAKINCFIFNSDNKLIHIDKIKKWPTLTSSGSHANLKLIDKNNNIRRITGLEMMEIQGFKLNNRMNDIFDTTLKFLAGNSISIYALKKHFKNINPKSVGVAFAGIDAIGEFFGRNKIVDYIEIDKKVVDAHNHIYETNYLPRDFLKVEKMKGELLHFSPPCINFSNQGKQSKIDEFSQNVINVIKKSNPKYISVENVLGYKKIMEKIKDNLNHLYEISIKQIEPDNQSRKRIFLLGIKK